jgi:hypothetical protein
VYSPLKGFIDGRAPKEKFFERKGPHYSSIRAVLLGQTIILVQLGRKKLVTLRVVVERLLFALLIVVIFFSFIKVGASGSRLESLIQGQSSVVFIVVAIVAVLVGALVVSGRSKKKRVIMNNNKSAGSSSSSSSATSNNSSRGGGSTSSAASAENSQIQELLRVSRESINNGDKDMALATLIRVISLTRGPAGVMDVLTKGRAMVDQADKERRIQELGSRQALLQAQRAEDERVLREAIEMCETLMQSECILNERDDGSEFILRDAFQDGSSVVCKLCGGLVKRERWEQHQLRWCPVTATNNGDNDDDDDDMDTE